MTWVQFLHALMAMSGGAGRILAHERTTLKGVVADHRPRFLQKLSPNAAHQSGYFRACKGAEILSPF